MSSSAERTVWTIGTAHREPDAFLALLLEHRIELLADVRSRPTSRQPHFRRDALEALLAAAGIGYAWLGTELGGHRRGGYEAYTATPAFAAGIARLEALAAARRTAVCCAELDPERCHRRHVADELVRRGWTVIHILRPGASREHRLEPRQRPLPLR